MQIQNIYLINSIITLQKLASENSSDFIDRLCNFLAEEFNFYAVVIFNITDNNKLIALGKSHSSRKSITFGEEYNCQNCKLLIDNVNNFAFNTDANCEVQITDFMTYEGCLLLRKSSNEKYLLKISQGTPFSQDDQNNLEIIGKLVLNLLENYSTDKVKTQQTISSLITEISNDLRTPTNSIVGFTSLLNDNKLTSTQAEYVNALKSNAQELLSLINDLIDLAKIETGSFQQNSLEINLRNFLNDIKNLFIEKPDYKNINLEIQIDSSVPNTLVLDSQKLKYILINLITYLINLTPTKKINIVSSFNAKKQLVIKVVDNDIVLPSSKINDFFSPSSIRELTNKKLNDITILTLALTKKYINLLGGEIEIISSLNKGTIISFYIKSDVVSPVEEKISGLPKLDGKNKVLVIEDDYATSKLLSNYLHKWGYEPYVVNTGNKALQILQREDFLSIITDTILPDISGLELLEKIRENKKTKNIPVIVCSVEADEQKAFLMGAVEYFQKPIRYKDLVEVLNSYKLRKNSNILCVDDDVPTLNLIKEAIQNSGYNAIAESVPTKVIGLIENIDLDLAIIDLEMPELNGYELIKLLKSNPRYTNLPIIIYTGKTNYEEELYKVEGLFTDLLNKKSSNIEDLAETINAMIYRYEEPTPSEVAAEQEEYPKILLVEDYKHSQIIVTRLLKKNNFNSVVVVENGAEALEEVKKQKYDLILMDMQMPVMNGFEATEKIRKLPEYKNTPIISLTAFAMKGDKEKCLAAGATDYIPKPIDSIEFIEKVKFYTAKVNQLQ